MRKWRILLVLLGALIIKGALLAEPLNVLVGDITFTRPPKWTWTDLKNSTAVTRFIVPNAADNKSSTECRFYMTDRTAAQNMARWKSFFSPEDQRTAREEKMTIGGREIGYLTLVGTFTFPPEKAKSGHRFVGAIIPSGKQSIVVRLVGPDRNAENATGDFRKMIEDALKESEEK